MLFYTIVFIIYYRSETMAIHAEKEDNNIKANILRTIERQLDKLNDNHNSEMELFEMKIDGLNNQLFSLKEKLYLAEISIENLEKDNAKLKDQVDILQNILLDNKDTKLIESYLIKFKERFGTQWLDKGIQIIESNIMKKYYSQSAYFISYLKNAPTKYFTEDHFSLLRDLGSSVFIEWVDLDDIDYELNYRSVFELLRVVGEVNQNKTIKVFLINELNTIKENVFLSNSSDSILEMFRCYMTYNLTEQLHDIFDDLLVEWAFLESDITEEQLSYIHTVSLFLDREIDILHEIEVDKGDMQKYRLESTADSQKFPSESESSPNNNEPPNEELHGKVLLDYITKIPNNVKYHPKKDVAFENVKVQIALYRYKYSSTAHGYYQTTVKKPLGFQEYFMTNKELKSLSKKMAGYWVDLKQVDMDLNLLNKGRYQLNLPEKLEQGTVNNSFKWPETDINTERGDTQKDTDLNTKSELRKLGYQISGISRVKRWEILEEKAVPQLGLKKVAYTIAFLVRGRKAMKNGLIKNKNSITEW